MTGSSGEDISVKDRSVLYEQEALRRVLVQKGLVSNEEVLEEVKRARRELEAKRAI
jgi:hypothetical protein